MIDEFLKVLESNLECNSINLAMIFGVILILFYGMKHLQQLILKHKQNLKHKANIKIYQENREAKINEFYEKHKNMITQEEILKICNLPVKELCEKIKTQEITSYKVFICYSLNCCTVAKNLNTIADIDFENGLQLARDADEKIKNNSNISDLPLLGIPISIKDHIPVEGYIDTFGLANFINNKAKKDCYLVEKLKKLGAIVLCKSNIPQSLMCAESSNYIFGECKNIWDKTRTTGGSSGGEGGLIQSFSSPFGIGSDIGGSIRAPCHYCGIYGFKPTSNRLPSFGFKEPDGTNSFHLENWRTSAGFLTNKFEDLIYFSELLFGKLNDNLYSCYLDQRKFNNDVYLTNKKLKIGYFYSYKEVEMLISQEEKIKTIVDLLSSKNHYETEEIDLNKFQDLYINGFKLIYILSTPYLKISPNSENLYNYYDFHEHLFFQSSLSKSLKNFLYKSSTESRDLNFMNNISSYKSEIEQYYEYIDFNNKKEEFFKYFKNSGIDVLIIPIYPFPAPKIGHCNLSNYFAFYNFLTAMTDMPSVIIPIGRTSKFEFTKTNYSDCFSKMLEIDFSSAKDLPFCIQVVSLPGNDELCLRVAKDISKLIKIDFNDLNNDNTQTQEFWNLRKIQNKTKAN